MITTVGDKMKGYGLHRRESLVITTIDVLDELGLQGLSTREIAKREGVSEATLFRHYKNKNKLLEAVLDYFNKFDKELVESAELMELRPKEAILYLVRLSAEYYDNYPAITAIWQVFDVIRYEPELEDKIRRILNNRTQFFKQLLEEAKAAGELRSDINSEHLSDMITGLYREVCLIWRMNNRQFSLKERIMSSLTLLLDEFFIS